MTTVNGVAVPSSSTLDRALESLLQSSQQTNTMLAQLAGEMRAMNEQLFHRSGVQAPLPGIGNPPPVPPSKVAPPGQETWAQPQQERQQGKCAEIGITKTRNLNKWKINFYMYGINKPASFYARDGYEQVLRFIGEVWPEANADLFSEERFNDRNKETRDRNPDRVHEDRYTVAPFLIEFTDSAPKQMENGMKISFRYAERVRPL